MYNFTLSQETDGSAHVRVINQSQDIVIGGSGLLFGGHVFKQVSDNVPRGLELVGGERNTARCLGPDSQGVIHIVFVKAASLNLLHGEVAGQLVDNGPYDLQVSQFLGAYRSLRNVPFPQIARTAAIYGLLDGRIYNGGQAHKVRKKQSLYIRRAAYCYRTRLSA